MHYEYFLPISDLPFNFLGDTFWGEVHLIELNLGIILSCVFPFHVLYRNIFLKLENILLCFLLWTSYFSPLSLSINLKSILLCSLREGLYFIFLYVYQLVLKPFGENIPFPIELPWTFCQIINQPCKYGSIVGLCSCPVIH